MAIPSDFQRIPGSARSYVNISTGEIVSRRQYQKLTNQQFPSKPAHAGAMNEYNQEKRKYQAELAKEGITKNLREISQDHTFKQLRKEKKSADIPTRINAWRKLGYRTHSREWYRQRYSGWEPDV